MFIKKVIIIYLCIKCEHRKILLNLLVLPYITFRSHADWIYCGKLIMLCFKKLPLEAFCIKLLNSHSKSFSLPPHLYQQDGAVPAKSSQINLENRLHVTCTQTKNQFTVYWPWPLRCGGFFCVAGVFFALLLAMTVGLSTVVRTSASRLLWCDSCWPL